MIRQDKLGLDLVSIELSDRSGRLVDLMIEHNLGVKTTKTYELKEVSNDLFDESEGIAPRVQQVADPQSLV